MKLKKLQKFKYSNLELQILKQFSKKKNFNRKVEIKLTEILLNKIASIIYFYHITNKTILFVGFPKNLTKILKTTKHISIPEFIWQSNMFNNNFISNNKKIKIPKNIFKLQTKLKKKVDLIVINNLDINMIAFKESYLARIPAITITKKIDISKVKSDYNITGSYHFFAEKEENSNFFYLFLKSVLMRAKKCYNNTLSTQATEYKKKTAGFKLFH